MRFAVALPGFVCSAADSILQIFSRMRYGYGSRLIPLSQGKFAIVDGEDYWRLRRYKWYVTRSGRHWYAARYRKDEQGGSFGKAILMHRDLVGCVGDKFVDHINGNGLDNRKANLRPATQHENSWNRQKQRGNYSSRFKGVCWSKRKRKWRAKITCDGREKYLGVFSDEESAARAYDAKARELFGEFARQNFR